MADKKTELSIVIRTVDQATAKIKAINERLDEATKPIRNLKSALGELREKSGLAAVSEGFKGVGEAAKEALFKVVEIGAVVGEATHLVLELVESFEDLGKKAERIGVSVDFFAGMRDAATRTGGSVEALDSGLQAFTQSLGQARAGTGRMAAFIEKVSPALLRQLKHAKSNEEAFNLLADAMAKISDPAKRLALAQKTLGDASLAPLLAKGSKGIKELRDHYLSLAGSQEEAAKASIETGESLKDLHAATDGVKAALVEGLAPALTIIVGQLAVWFSGHREDIKRWAKEIGERLPGAVHEVADAIGGALSTVGDFVDAIGGWKVAAGALAAVMAGPLLLSLVKLGATLATTPFGRVVLALSTLVSLFLTLRERLGNVSAVIGTVAVALAGLFALKRITAFIGMIKSATTAMLGLGEASAAANAAGVGGKVGGSGVLGKVGMVVAPIAAAQLISDLTGGSIQDQAHRKGWTGEDWDLSGAMQFLSHSHPAVQRANAAMQASAAIAATGAAMATARIVVDFANAPRGTRVSTAPGSTADVDFNVGYQLMGFGS